VIFSVAGACAASCICQACTGANRAAARFIYAAIFFITVILAWIVRDYSDGWLKTLHREFFVLDLQVPSSYQAHVRLMCGFLVVENGGEEKHSRASLDL
jgi:hypothetical protein